MKTKDLQDKINLQFLMTFGRTPLRQRLDDILGEAIELSRATDLTNLREEAGDLLASTMALCAECGWDAESLVEATLSKIQRRENLYRALGRKLKVCILGGGFDPPTIGHIKMAKFVLDTSREFDEVWLCPCFQHMYGKKMAPPEKRLEMCRLATECDGRIQIFDYEIANKLRGETYHFVKRLLDEDFAKDTYDFSIVIGMDNANTFDKWVNYQLLKDLIRFVVVSRKGTPRNENVNWYLSPPHIYINDCSGEEIPPTSSTEVRSAIKRGELDQLAGKVIDKKVADYIKENGLYLEKSR